LWIGRTKTQHGTILGNEAMFRFRALAKRLLPKPIQRLLLIHVLHVNRRYSRLLNAASRLCLQDEILPWVRDRYASVLFVGTAAYTYHYEELFRPGQYTTMDVESVTAVWGAANHIVAPVQDINRHRPKGAFDCIVLNGVFGFGVDTVEEMRVVLRELHAVLRPGGFLVVGWNTDRHADPHALGLYRGLFVANEEPPWTERRRFPPETHVYDFYRRCPAQDSRR
jgi:SAM-dependent methyltransferase